MMSSSFDDIKEQEEDIFEDLSSYDLSSLDVSNGELYPSGESAQVVSSSAKNQARRQLAVSEDSPFCNVGHVYETGEIRRLKEEKAARLREETDAIKRQLDIVKNRLNELKGNCTADYGIHHDGSQQPIEPKRVAAGSKRPDSTPAGPHRNHESTDRVRPKAPIASARLSKQSEPKFRPLTGKADCPNCNCDRRSSVCDRCISIAITKPIIGKSKPSIKQTALNEPKGAIYHDDRPIRSTKERIVNETGQIEIDSSIVPNRVYTISKSLNDKRTKLAQAIDELQLTMDQVKEKGNKLEQERKLVQLYKDQWKFGPTIGGPIASPRDRLNTDKKQQQRQHQQRRTYESRLDPNLTRDSKSLMGFQHIGAAMRLRNYHDTKDNTMKRRPMTDRMKPSMHSRSRSLESLKLSGKNPTIDSGHRVNNAQRFAPAHKSSSELAINKAARNNDANEELEEVAEDLEEEIHDNGDDQPDADQQPSQVCPPIEVAVESGPVDNNTKNSAAGNMQRMTWIPVFGETEIKTIKRDLPKRKIQIITPNSQAGKQQSNINRTPLPRSRSGLKSVLSHNVNRTEAPLKCNNTKTFNNETSNNFNGRVIVEAQRKLQVYSNLLEQEQRDAVGKNQLIVTRSAAKPTPKPRLARAASPFKATHNHHQEQVQSNESNAHKSSMSATAETSKEIARIEEMVNEQQRLLAKLAQAHERPLISPVTVSCSSPCCHHRASPSSKISGGSAPHRLVSNPTSNNRSLINTLRDRLNKSKMRLARILEEEREKHQKLKQKVDSSLRKQSDLENENELLKQSLSKCIDTCLKDISNTFESLSETLDDSVNGLGNLKHSLDDGDRMPAGQTDGAVLTNAAQLIADNRHLKQMRCHIETIERQRRAIFDELAKEKQRSNQFESQLKESQNELRQLLETKRRLESRLDLVSDEQSDPPPLSESDQQVDHQSKPAIESNQIATSKQSTLNNLSSQTETTDKSDMDDTYNSVDVYRRYIQSMSPDLESLKRDRMVILSEFDNIKKILSDIDK